MRKLQVFAGMMVLLLVTCSAQAGDSPTVQLRLEASPRTITIGDPIKMEIAVVTSSGVIPSPFKVPESLGEFEFRNLTSSPPQKLEGGKISVTHSFYATTFSTGTIKIPSLSLAFTAPDGIPAETKTEEISIEVKSILAEKGDEGGIRPLKGLYNFPSYAWLWVLLGILAAVSVVFWLRSLSKKKLKDSGFLGGPPILPEEWAWNELNKLEDSDLIEKGMVKEFYIRLSVILRDYLERRYGVSALERTTAELLGELRKLNFSLNLNSTLREFLETADLAKFAKFTPEEAEIEKDLSRIKEVVTLTTPQPINTEAKETAKAIPV